MTTKTENLAAFAGSLHDVTYTNGYPNFTFRDINIFVVTSQSNDSTLGRLGIGTSSPAEKLHVQGGDIRIQQIIPELKFVSEGAVNKWYIGANISDTVNGGLHFGSGDNLASGSTYMYITGEGRVGIGTAAPETKLHVAQAGDAIQILASNGVISQAVGYCGYGGTYSGSLSDHPYILITNNVERIRIGTTGNVGIGTSSPATRLHVDGTIRYTNRPAAGTITAIGFDSNGDLKASSSSQRYKYDIEDYSKGLDEVMQLRPVSFKYNEETRTNIGFIAEEIDAAGLSEVMLYDEEERPEGVLYANMIALLTKAIQEQQTMIASLEARLATVESQ